jgi:hypothetical protein
MARARTPQAIEALTAALANPRERVAAACALLDRAWGKPQQQVVGDEDRPHVIRFEWGDATHPEAAAADNSTDASPLVLEREAC